MTAYPYPPHPPTNKQTDINGQSIEVTHFHYQSDLLFLIFATHGDRNMAAVFVLDVFLP